MMDIASKPANILQSSHWCLKDLRNEAISYHFTKASANVHKVQINRRAGHFVITMYLETRNLDGARIEGLKLQVRRMKTSPSLEPPCVTKSTLYMQFPVARCYHAHCTVIHCATDCFVKTQLKKQNPDPVIVRQKPTGKATCIAM